MAESVFHPLGEFNLAEMRCPKRRAFEHFFVDGGDDFGMGMTVNQRSPRLHKINEDVPVDIGHVCTRRFLEVNRVAVNGLEGPHGGVYAADQMRQRLVVELVGFGSVHANTSCHPLLPCRLSGVVGDDDAGAGSFERCQHLYHHITMAIVVRLGAHHHRILPADVVNGHGSNDGVGNLSHHVEIGQTGLDHDDAVDAFMNALADRVIHNHAESVFDAKLVCVIGSSGSGKTTLATKIAAYFKENSISERITLASATGQGIGQNEDIKSYARLLNMRSTDFGIGELATAIQETSNRMIVDVDAGSSDALEAILAARQHLGRGRVSVVQAVPGGSSATMITHQCRLFQKLKPLIALTKLDECESRPAELSALALEGSGVGLLTGTTAIVGGIAIATTPILAQYLKANADQ